MYGMHRTTIYLPEELKARLESLAAAEGVSEAEIIRLALGEKLDRADRPAPTVPLFASRGRRSDVAERVDELLVGFGEQ